MPVSPRRTALDLAVPAVVAATVFAFALGSSSVPALARAGRPARWVMLLVLLAVALVAAWPRLRSVRPPVSVIAAASAFLVVALLSATWSVAPRLTFERAGSLVLLFAAAGALAIGVAGRPAASRGLLVGLLAGAAVVAVAGVLLLAIDYSRAVQAATIEVPWRFQGVGENPNTAALLYGLAVPIAVWFALASGRRRLATAVLILLLGSIAASSSRGALAAAAVGALVPAVALPRRARARILAAGSVAATAVVIAAIQAIPQPLTIGPAAAPTRTAASAAGATAKPPRYVNVEKVYPLNADVGRPLPGGGEPTVRRTFLGTSGRAQAWVGALHQAVQRPLLGFGFGMEARVFVNRYYGFEAGLPENAYIGIALQLGAVGLVMLVGLVALLAWSGRRALATPVRPQVLACLGLVAAGAVAAVAQSYVYSVGDIAAGTFWIGAFLLPALAMGERHA